MAYRVPIQATASSQHEEYTTGLHCPSVPPLCRESERSLRRVYCDEAGEGERERLRQKITTLEKEKIQLQQKIGLLEKEKDDQLKVKEELVKSLQKDKDERLKDQEGMAKCLKEKDELLNEKEGLIQKLQKELDCVRERKKEVENKLRKVSKDGDMITLSGLGKFDSVEYFQDERDYLGEGCMAIVYKGKSRSSREYDVAIKVMQAGKNTKKIESEIMLLKDAGSKCDKIVKYLFTVEDISNYYLIMELCDTSLYQFIDEGQSPKSWNSFKRHAAYKDLLYQAMEGLIHLHSKGIVHRDMKPQNILLRKLSAERHGYRVKISDFGLSREMCEGQKSMTREQRGSRGWTAPEILNKALFTGAVDIFCMGCVLYFVLSDGKHPFSDDVDLRDSRIKDKNVKCELVHISEIDFPVKKLVEDMLAFDSTERPSALQVKGHCFFWDEECQISFINDVMAILDGCSAKEKEATINCIMAEIMAEINISQKNVTNWYDIMDEEVRKDLLDAGSHTCSSLLCLLRDKTVRPPKKQVVEKLKKILCSDEERIEKYRNPSVQSQPTVQPTVHPSSEPVAPTTAPTESLTELVMVQTKGSKPPEIPNGSMRSSNGQRVFSDNLVNRQKDILAQHKALKKPTAQGLNSRSERLFASVVAGVTTRPTGPATETVPTTTGPATATTETATTATEAANTTTEVATATTEPATATTETATTATEAANTTTEASTKVATPTTEAETATTKPATEPSAPVAPSTENTGSAAEGSAEPTTGPKVSDTSSTESSTEPLNSSTESSTEPGPVNSSTESSTEPVSTEPVNSITESFTEPVSTEPVNSSTESSTEPVSTEPVNSITESSTEPAVSTEPVNSSTESTTTHEPRSVAPEASSTESSTEPVSAGPVIPETSSTESTAEQKENSIESPTDHSTHGNNLSNGHSSVPSSGSSNGNEPSNGPSSGNEPSSGPSSGNEPSSGPSNGNEPSNDNEPSSGNGPSNGNELSDRPADEPVETSTETSFNVADKIVVLRYLTSRFPMLLVSTWHAMKEKYGDSDNLRQYYPPHADSSIPTH